MTDEQAAQLAECLRLAQWITGQCDNIAVNIYGNPDGANPPYAASVWGRVDTVSRQTADVQNGVTAALATLWGNTDNPPYGLSVNGMLVQVLSLMGYNPWDPPEAGTAVLTIDPPAPAAAQTPTA